MKDLIERLEKLDGPCRECDVLIWEALGNCAHRNTKPYRVQSDTGFTCVDCGVDMYGKRDPAPKYSSSIDAALTLIPDGWVIASLEWWKPRSFSSLTIFEVDEHGNYDADLQLHARGQSVSPAIAICIAALRARRPYL